MATAPSAVNVLSAKLARAAIEQDDCALSEYTEIEESAAKALARYEGWVGLDGLSTITDSVARSLSKHRGELSLNGLVHLTQESAGALAKHSGRLLSLDGLGNSLTEASYLLSRPEQGPPKDEIRKNTFGTERSGTEGFVATYEADFKKTLEVLANHRGTLSLGGLGTSFEAEDGSVIKRSEFSEEIAKCLYTHEGPLLLWGLASITLESAEILANAKSALGLGLLTITRPIAEALARHKSGLWLDGLTELSEETAAILSKHQGDLSFDSVRALSSRAAKALAKHKGLLYLAGLEELSVEFFDVFTEHEGKVSVPLLTDIEKVAHAEGNGDREFIVGLDFYYCNVTYSGFKIMERAEIRGLLAALETDGKVGTPNMPGSWWEEFDIALLKGCFEIHSPWPSDIKSMRKLFGERVGETSLFDSVMKHAPSRDGQEDDEED